jgi:archaellum component FlaC
MNLKGRGKVERISTNIKVYDLEESLVASGYAMLTDYNEEEIKKEIELLKENVSTDSKHYKRAERL